MTSNLRVAKSAKIDQKKVRTRDKSALRPSQEPKVRRQRKAPQIIEAAAKVFAQRGFHGTKTQDIGDLLGIRQASLYYYFRSKEAALELVCARGVEGYHESAESVLKGGGTSIDRLASLIRSHLEPNADRADFVHVFLNERQHLPARSRHRIGKTSRKIEKIFEKVIRQGVDAGEMRPDIEPRITSLAVLGMANSVSAWFQKEGVPLDKIVKQMTDLVVVGLASHHTTSRL